MNSKEIDQTKFDYIKNVEVIEEAVALDQSLRAEDAPVESYLVAIQPINIQAEKIRLLAEQSQNKIA